MQGAITEDDFRAYLERIKAEENEVSRRAEDSGT
jgi:predicted transcriptional regulator